MMYNGHQGNRHANNDPNGLIESGRREHTDRERTLLSMLWQRECEMRDFIAGLPQDADRRSVAMALTKLDELVLWAKRAIDT